jgi:hypothetical protein
MPRVKLTKSVIDTHRSGLRAGFWRGWGGGLWGGLGGGLGRRGVDSLVGAALARAAGRSALDARGFGRIALQKSARVFD